MAHDVELILDAKAQLAEGPVWDEYQGIWYWVDIFGETVHTYDPRTGEDHSVNVGQKVGAVVPVEGGGLLVMAALHGFYLLDAKNGSMTALHDPEAESEKGKIRFNDGKCDALGRFWCGSMGMRTQERLGSLYVMDAYGQSRRMLTDIGISNGMAWSLDCRTFYHVDTLSRQIFAYNYDLSRCVLSDRRIIVQYPLEGNVMPDGMTIDIEGNLWVAEWCGWQVSCWNPHTGERIRAIPVPVEKVTSCTFGGPQLDELLITTARIYCSEEDLVNQPYAGGLFKVKPGVRGLPAHRFLGVM